MKKHLIYMGYTGTAHRIALFDENNIVTRNVPVKDVTVLSDDLEFLNCTVVKGQPIPNLMGAKVLSTCPKGAESQFGVRARRQITEKDLWAFKNTRPTYLYGGFSKYGLDSGPLHCVGYGLNIWDGLCKENYFYVIGKIVAFKTPDRNHSTENLLCMNHIGSLFFMTNNTITVLDNAGAVFVQVGTPEVQYPNSYDRTGSCVGRVATVGIPQSEAHKVIWISRKRSEIAEIRQTAEYIWWGGGAKSTVYDMRKYPSARVVGISSCAEDASVVILPESIEEMWLGMFYECTSLKAVYIPANISVIHECGLPPRRFKNVTLYSNSHLIEEFCKRKNVAYKPCASADELLEQFFQPTAEEYISVDDASNLAVLAGRSSNEVGESGKLWSAILFSFNDKGIATDTLRERYPVVETCDLAIPSGYIKKSVRGNVEGDGKYSTERCRTLAAALTQFYPLFTGYETQRVTTTYKCRMGDYNLYVVKDVLNLGKLPKEEYQRNFYLNYHIALLEDIVKGRIIHRFECNEMLYSVMCNLEGMCNLDQSPSGVLRYADKLPATSNDLSKGRDTERHQFVRELFNTFLPFMYGTAKVKQKVIGIDLHSGNLATIDFTPYYHLSERWGTSTHRTAVSLECVGTAKKINVYLSETHTRALFAKDCVYNKTKGGAQSL